VASLDFERPLRDLHRRIAALRAVALAGTRDDDGLAAEIERLEARAQQLQRDLFDELGAWDKVQLSRHPERPYTLDYIARWSRASSRCTATGCTATTRPSSAGSGASGAARWCSSGIRRAAA
jgi:acetyl-CoA carboxylase carboxyl transferase subunit alpha